MQIIPLNQTKQKPFKTKMHKNKRNCVRRTQLRYYNPLPFKFNKYNNKQQNRRPEYDRAPSEQS